MSKELVKVSSGDGIRLQGFIEIELVNEKEHYTKTYKNTITKGGKQFLLGHSAAQMLNMSANMRGNAMVNSRIIERGNGTNNEIPYLACDDGYCLTNLLLNLGELQTGLTDTSTWVNLFDSIGGIDTTKVVGYANNNLHPLSNGREGSIDYCKDEYVADGYTVCERWKYPEGVATGTIDTIAMAPAGWRGASFIECYGGGIRFSKCIDRVNLQAVNNPVRSTSFCPPGIPGVTSDDEIILNYQQDGVYQHRYNISTGAITDSPANLYMWFVFPQGTTDIVKVGNYIYSLEGSTGEVSVWQEYNMQVMSFPIYTFWVDYSYTTDPYNHINLNYRFIVDGDGELWVSCDNKYGYGNIKLYRLTRSGNYYDASEPSYTNFSNIFTVPYYWKDNVNFGMCGSNYVAYLKKEHSYFQTEVTTQVYTAIIFTDPEDILGSIVDIIPEVYDTSHLFAAGTIYGVIDIGYKQADWSEPTLDTDSRRRIISNSYGDVDINTNSGCYLTLNGWYSTLMSFVKLQTPIVKQDTDIMYVSYGYKVV